MSPPIRETLDALRRLKSLNYRIALDDFVYSDGPRPHDRTRRFCEARSPGARTRRAFSSSSRCCAPSTSRIVAEKIESEAEFRWCRKLGCDLFQGYYLRRPEMLSGRRIPSNRLSVLSLLSECANLENSAGMIAATIARDAPLTYGLLRLANSALYRRRSEIRSPAQAVMMLGMDFVSRWATLLALSGNDDCPTGYLEAALQRARMSELIGAAFHCSAQESYITGLLSTLDSVFNEPLAESGRTPADRYPLQARPPPARGCSGRGARLRPGLRIRRMDSRPGSHRRTHAESLLGCRRIRPQHDVPNDIRQPVVAGSRPYA